MHIENAMKYTMLRNSLKKSLIPQTSNILNSHTSVGKPLSILPPLATESGSADQEPELIGLCFRACKARYRGSPHLPARHLYAELQAAGIEVLLDHRDLRPGFMFADMELIGFPHCTAVGEKSLDDSKVEYRGR